MPKRDKVEIIGDMLSEIQHKNGRIKPTHLMYKANLSHAQLKSYLEELLDKEFVEKTETPKEHYTYIILTDKGNKFLQRWREMRQFETSFGF